MPLLYTLIGLALLTIVCIAVALRMRGKIAPQKRAEVLKFWGHVATLPTPEARVLEAEKVLDRVFTLLGGTGSFADKLRKFGPRLRNLQPVWDAHKLRNRIAHEPGMRVSPADGERAVAAFGKAVHGLVG